MEKTGTTYKSSDKIGYKIPFFKVIWLLLLSILNGVLFFLIFTFFNLNGLWTAANKFFFAFLCVLITGSAVHSMKNRNKNLTYFVAFLISIISWYNMWALVLCDYKGLNYFAALAHPIDVLILFSKIQTYEGAFFLPDIFAFFLSIILIYENPNDVIGYYCENCNEYYKTELIYIADGNFFQEDFNQASPGKYHFISRYESFKEVDNFNYKVSLHEPYYFIELTYDSCRKCKKDALLTIKKGEKILAMLDNNKSELSTKITDTLMNHMYIDDFTAKIIEDKIWEAEKKLKPWI